MHIYVCRYVVSLERDGFVATFETTPFGNVPFVARRRFLVLPLWRRFYAEILHFSREFSTLFEIPSFYCAVYRIIFFMDIIVWKVKSLGIHLSYLTFEFSFEKKQFLKELKRNSTVAVLK